MLRQSVQLSVCRCVNDERSPGGPAKSASSHLLFFDKHFFTTTLKKHFFYKHPFRETSSQKYFVHTHFFSNTLSQTLFDQHSSTNVVLHVFLSKQSFTNSCLLTLFHNHSFTTHVTNYGSLASVHGLMPTCPSHVTACVTIAAFFLAQVWKHTLASAVASFFCLSQHE